MKRALSALAIAILILPAVAQDKLAPGVVAKMGEVEIRADEVKVLLDAASPEARAQLAQAPAELNRLIRNELLRRVLAAEARTKGWDKRPDVATQMERAREQVLVSSYMDSVARPPASFPAEADIRAAYDQSPNLFATPKQYRLSQVFVLAPAESDKSGVAKAQAKITDAAERSRKRGADFAALAKSVSEHAESATKGGDMGWVAEQSLIPELREPVAALKKGEIAGPIRTAQGWHVVRLEDVREKGVRPLSEVRDQIVAALRLRRAQETEQAYLTLLNNRNPVSLNEAELGRLQGTLK
jgi:parvulin-like peptidyl-prolyl isomerase